MRAPRGDQEEITAERGVAAMAHGRTRQSRLSAVLAMLLCGALGLGLLAWYYAGLMAHPAASRAGRPVPVSGGAAEVALPPLGPIREALDSASAGSGPGDSVAALAAVVRAPQPLALPPSGPTTPPAIPAPTRQSPLERRLEGPAFAGSSTPSAPVAQPAAAPTTVSTGLAELLSAMTPPLAAARELPNQRLLLAKGAFIDCTLETAIDSALPGMTTCITATDTFGVDGKVVLLERGSKLVGETRGQVQQGSSRLFVLWTEARTPTGVVVPLASPGTDALGRSGLDGEVDRHFWQRFGAAMLISIVDGAALAAQRSGGSATIVDTSGSQGVATEALRGTVGIAPTLTKRQGDRIQVLVARDLDFRQVYQLRESGAPHQP
jgi:type IV secretion system protein VirB10